MPVRANTPIDKVRQLQRQLYVCAKESRSRRFHALYDRIYRRDVLWEAWERVRRNRGAAGIDAVSIQSIEESGAEVFVDSLHEILRAGSYRPTPVRRCYIPKADGRKRPLGIPTVKDRVVQMAAKLVIEPIFEADFKAASFGFRPRKSATDALEAIRMAGNRGLNFVIDADIKSYFETIDQEKLLSMVEKRVSDRRVVKLIRQWLRAGVMEDGTVRETLAGTPQGGVISPLLSNIFLDYLDSVWAAECSHLGELVRYADDFVVMSRTPSTSREALRRLHGIMQRLGLTLHPEKTKTVDLRRGRDSFVFLGCAIRKKRSILRRPDCHFMQRWPSPRAMNRLRERLHDLTDARHAGADLRDIIASLNPVLRGWGQYFRSGTCDREFQKIDEYVYRRLRSWHWRRGGQRRRCRSDQWPRERYHELGLHRLRGSVRYPANATPERPSVSRVREIRTHGLKGGPTTFSSTPSNSRS